MELAFQAELAGAAKPPRHRRKVVVAGQIAASLLLLAYLISRVGEEDTALLGGHFSSMEWSSAGPVLLVVVIAGGASVFASAVRLRAIARSRGTDLSVGAAVRINCLSLLAAVFVPFGLVGDGLRIVVLVRRHEVAIPGAIGVVVTDRIAGLVASCGVAIVGLALAPPVPGAADAERLLLVVTCLVTVAVAAVLVLAAWMQGSSEEGSGDGLRAKLARFGIIDLRALRSRTVVLTSIGGQVLEVVSAVALVRLFGFMRPPVGLIAVVSSFLPILEALPAAFIGLGAREGALEFLLVRSGEPNGSGLIVGVAGLGIRLLVIGVLLAAVALRSGQAAEGN